MTFLQPNLSFHLKSDDGPIEIFVFYVYMSSIPAMKSGLSEIRIYPDHLTDRKSGTHRTFPVPWNIPPNVSLFLVSSVFRYSMGEQGKVKRNLYFFSFF